MGDKKKILLQILLLFVLSGVAILGHAGMDRLWFFGTDETEEQINECKNLDKAQQQQLIQAYQAMRDDEQRLNLKKRMEWFCNLSDEQQQKMRLAWQSLSSKQREQLKKQFANTTDPVKREQLRQDLMNKYGHVQ